MSSSAEHITVLPIIIGMAAILSCALLGRIGARKLGVRTTLGELLAGILVGNLSYYFGYDLMIILREGASWGAMARLSLDGYSWNEAAQQVLGPDVGSTFVGLLQGPQGNQYFQVSQAMDMFTHYGVLFVLFYVGLSTHVVERLRQRETDALKVAAMGAVLPMTLGFLVAWLLIPEATHLAHLFIAATLATTGIAVTAQVFNELGRTHSSSCRAVLNLRVWPGTLFSAFSVRSAASPQCFGGQAVRFVNRRDGICGSRGDCRIIPGSRCICCGSANA